MMHQDLIKESHSPAFASVGYSLSGDGYCQIGLTKREYFAAMAMQGLCVEGAFATSIQKAAENVGSNASEAIALYAVDLADALITALNTKLP